MLSKVVRSGYLPSTVVRMLGQSIHAGEFKPGERLPTEHELAERLGVSRPVVREAIAQLKSDGYVETRQGAGAFVASVPGMASFKLRARDELDADELRQIFELRLGVEVIAAELAALRRTEADIATIRMALDRVDKAIRDSEDGVEADDTFHCAIAAATHNLYLQRFVAFLGHHFAATRAPAWSPKGRSAGKPQAAQREHKKLFSAIVANDPRAARAAARAHLENSAARLIGSIADRVGKGVRRTKHRSSKTRR